MAVPWHEAGTAFDSEAGDVRLLVPIRAFEPIKPEDFQPQPSGDLLAFLRGLRLTRDYEWHGERYQSGQPAFPA